MKRLLPIIILLLFVFSCHDEAEILPVTFRFGTETDFKTGNVYYSDSHSLEFKIAEIYDSRCPSDVVCVWQGEAVVKIMIEAPIVDSLQLSTYDNQKDTVAGMYSFELVEVAPYPVSTDTINAKDYNVTLKIEELE